MDDFEESAMIALLPTNTDWCQIDLPHMTLVYAGEISALKIANFSELAKDAAMLAQLSNPINVKVTGVEIFGKDDEQVDVMTLEATQQLLAMRRAVEGWNASEWPFKPHATIGPVGSADFTPPSFLTFDRIMVAWGNDNLTFWLKPKVV